jgi:hypothetical protein
MRHVGLNVLFLVTAGVSLVDAQAPTPETPPEPRPTVLSLWQAHPINTASAETSNPDPARGGAVPPVKTVPLKLRYGVISTAETRPAATPSEPETQATEHDLPQHSLAGAAGSAPVASMNPRSTDPTGDASGGRVVPVSYAPVSDIPVDSAPAKSAPLNVPADNVPVKHSRTLFSYIKTLPPSGDANGPVAPVAYKPIGDAPAENTPADNAPVNSAPVSTAPLGDAPVDDAPARPRRGIFSFIKTLPPSTPEAASVSAETDNALSPPEVSEPPRPGRTVFSLLKRPETTTTESPAPALLPPTESGDAPPVPAEQPQQQLPLPTLLPKETEAVGEPLLDFAETGEPVNLWWTSGEYLLWRTRHPGLGYPLETASILGASRGILGTFNTVKYFDGGDLSFGNYSGARLTFGRWFDATQTYGIEGSAFFLSSPGQQFVSIATLTSPSLVGANGIPATPISIFRPYVSAATLAPQALLLGSQAASAGGIFNPTGALRVDTTSNLWGAEANLIRKMYSTDCIQICVLAGPRYLDLKEDLDVATVSRTSAAPLIFGVLDRFVTHNEFAGGQIGARLDCHKGCFAATVTTKLALGNTFETLDVGGLTTAVNGNTFAVYNAGFLALPSNSGHFTKDEFSVVPQVGLTLGYQAGQHCRFFLGYDFLYWTKVARPGDQINPTLDPAQVPSLTPNQPSQTAVQPQALFVTRDFWAQGVSFGLEVRY